MKKALFFSIPLFLNISLFGQLSILCEIQTRFDEDSTAQYTLRQRYSYENNSLKQTVFYDDWNPVLMQFKNTSSCIWRFDAAKKPVSKRCELNGGIAQSIDWTKSTDNRIRSSVTNDYVPKFHWPQIISKRDTFFNAAGKPDSINHFYTYLNDLREYAHIFKYQSDGKLIEYVFENRDEKEVYRSKYYYDEAISDSTVLIVHDYKIDSPDWLESGRDSFFYDMDKVLFRKKTFGNLWYPSCNLREPDRVIEYFYDANGREIKRIAKTFWDTGALQETSIYEWEHDQIDLKTYNSFYQLFGSGTLGNGEKKVTYWSENHQIMSIDHFKADKLNAIFEPDWKFHRHEDYFYEGLESKPKSLKIELNIYPNPAQDGLSVHSEAFFSQPVSWKIVDILGKTRASGQSNGNYEYIHLGIDELDAGPYFFTVEIEGKKAVKSFNVR